MSLFSRGVRVVKRDGIIPFLSKTSRFMYYRFVRDRLPFLAPFELNGVKVRHETDNRPRFEDGLMTAQRQHIEEGDTILVIGAGKGATTVDAARQTGDSGSVIAIEGSARHTNWTLETVSINGVSNVVTVRHAIVGDAVNLAGDQGQAECLSPTELPECDVLSMDAEGAELEILFKLEIRPRVIIVETHGHLGCPPQDVKDQLSELGYDITNTAVAEVDPPKLREKCESRGVLVITAVRQDG